MTKYSETIEEYEYFTIKDLTNDYANAYNVIRDKGIEKERAGENLILKIGGKYMKMTEETEQILVKKITEIFEGLPEHAGRVQGSISITIEGDIIISFNDPIKLELIRLFKKQYISPLKQISNYNKVLNI